MKTKILFIVIVSLFVFTCASKVRKSSRSSGNCKKTYVDDFASISNSFQDYVVKNDTIKLNSIKFECTYTAFYTCWSMYNLFGEWHKGVNPDNNKHRTYLIWENIDLLSNNDRYTVVTFGVEKLDDIFSSVMVFDKEGKDMLSENSEVKSKVIDFFSKEIRKKKNKKMKTIFYQKYIKQFKPEYWKKYKNFPNVKIHID